jgi:hypothetical protein
LGSPKNCLASTGVQSISILAFMETSFHAAFVHRS